METVLWIAQGLLAAVFFTAGSLKLVKSHAELAAIDGMQWVEDFGPRHLKGIGTLEVLGAVGVILPAALDIAPVLTPIAPPAWR